MTIDDEIQKLSARYYEIIGNDHHKDNDCHFEIVKRWSYGNKYHYSVGHIGYLHTADYKEYNNYLDAAKYLASIIRNAIGQELKQAREIVNDPDGEYSEIDIKIAKEKLEEK